MMSLTWLMVWLYGVNSSVLHKEGIRWKPNNYMTFIGFWFIMVKNVWYWKLLLKNVIKKRIDATERWDAVLSMCILIHSNGGGCNADGRHARKVRPRNIPTVKFMNLELGFWFIMVKNMWYWKLLLKNVIKKRIDATERWDAVLSMCILIHSNGGGCNADGRHARKVRPRNIPTVKFVSLELARQPCSDWNDARILAVLVIYPSRPRCSL